MKPRYISRNVATLALISFTLGPILAEATPIPAQPATDIRPKTKKDPDGNANPFHITQVEEKLFFIASTDKGPALYVRDIEHSEVDGAPVIEMVGKKLKPKLVKPFKKTQTFDDQIVGAYIQNLGSTKPTTLNGALYFHLPGFGLYTSRGSRGTTKSIATTDKKGDPDNWMTSLIYVPQSSGTTHQLLFAATDKKKGREIFTARSKNDDTSSDPVFDKKHTGIFADILEGSESSEPSEIVAKGNRVFFAAISPVTHQREIFLSEDNGAPTPLSENLGMAEGLASNETDCVFAGSSTVGGETDLYVAKPEGVTKVTFNGSSPTNITWNGASYLFSVRTTNNLGRELAKITVGTNTNTLGFVADINTGTGSSDPGQFLSIGGDCYFTAFDGTARRLYRTDGFDVEEIKANDGASLVVDALHEKTVVFNTLYFTATKEGQSAPWLWKINNNAVSTNAARVNTAGGFPVAGAMHLTEYRSPSGNRLYFSCDGAGTEFTDEEAGDKRFHPRGRELWVTAE